MILAVDFDGVCVEACFPSIGGAMPGALAALRRIFSGEFGDVKVILWTCRCGEFLDQALAWFDKHGLPLPHQVNQNCPETIRMFRGTDSRKVFAHIYAEDQVPGGFCGWEA